MLLLNIVTLLQIQASSGLALPTDHLQAQSGTAHQHHCHLPCPAACLQCLHAHNTSQKKVIWCTPHAISARQESCFLSKTHACVCRYTFFTLAVKCALQTSQHESPAALLFMSSKQHVPYSRRCKRAPHTHAAGAAAARINPCQ